MNLNEDAVSSHQPSGRSLALCESEPLKSNTLKSVAECETLNLLEHQEKAFCRIQVGVREHYWIMAAKCDQPALVGDGKQYR